MLLTCASVLLPTGEEGLQNSGNTVTDEDAVLLLLLGGDKNIVETLLGPCKKSVKSMDSVRKGLSRGSLKSFVSVHSKGEAENMKAEMTSSPVVLPRDCKSKTGEGEGALELALESDWTNGSGLGNWGTVAREDVGVLAVETTPMSRSTSSEVGCVGRGADTQLSLINSSSGVTSERNNCMRRSVVAGSLSRTEVSRSWDSVMSAIMSATSGGLGPLKSPAWRGRKEIVNKHQVIKEVK